MNSDLDMPRKFTYKPSRLFFLNPCSMDHPKDEPLQQGICQKIPPVVHNDFTPQNQKGVEKPIFFLAFQARIWAVIRAMTSI